MDESGFFRGLSARLILAMVFLGLGTGAGAGDAASARQGQESSAGDWPQWRYDAGRGASTPVELPADLKPRWIRHLPPPQPAWPESQPALRFDESYCPVAADNRLFVPSTVNDSVTAYDLSTGTAVWRFFAEGPVRLAPVADRGRLYFGSDDGYLYCVDAAAGTLRWRVRGGPTDRRIIGNERLISTWPVRGGPVLLNGRLYFTAGIWPFMGIFVHAIDAETGKSLWIGSGDSSTYVVQPHNSPAFSGFVPRGHLAATPSGLVAPGGRTQPGCYDLETGRLESFSFGAKNGGTYHVTARGRWFFAGGSMRNLGDGKVVEPMPVAVHDAQALYGVAAGELFAQSLPPEEEKSVRAGKQAPALRSRPLWKVPLGESPGELFLKAGPRFYFGRRGEVAAVEAQGDRGSARVTWRGAIEGDPWAMLAAQGRLVVVTRGGSIYCFDSASEGQGPQTYRESGGAPQGQPEPGRDGHGEGLIASVLGELGAVEGYAVVLGIGKGQWIDAILRRTSLEQIVWDDDRAGVDRLRRRLDEQGLYGRRVSVHVGDLLSSALPPYLASLIVVEALPSAQGDGQAAWLGRLFETLRPYGGAACLPLERDRLEALVVRAGLEKAKVKALDAGHALLVREGALPGAADWTHQYADAANSVVSEDDRVKTPLGLLWFGGPANDEVLPRHGHGPSPLVAGGRVIVEGRNMLRAIDAYTGRKLWQRDLPDLGQFYDNTSHQPGANEIGSNYVALADAVYVVHAGKILKLDAANGNPCADFKVRGQGEGDGPDWGFLAACDDLLVATSAPLALPRAVSEGKPAGKLKSRSQNLWALPDSPAADPFPGSSGIGSKSALQSPLEPTLETSAAPGASGRGKLSRQFRDRSLEPTAKPSLAPGSSGRFEESRYSSTSGRLAVLDRHTGKVLWDRPARYGFRHNGIAVGGGRVFCLDALSPAQRDALKRHGRELPDYAPRLLALDLRTGREAWSTGEDVFGTFLNYSAQHQVLLQSGSAARDRAADEADRGMAVYRAGDGRVLWKNLKVACQGPCLLVDGTIIAQGRAYDLLTGEPKVRRHPLSGETIPWQYTRNYGCNTAIGGRHLLAFRSAAAGYYDLDRDGGTGNLGGFKSGCSSNLIPADGVLCAPEYTRTCTCPYQNQTSLGLIHDPNAEMWTFNSFRWDGRPVRRVGINLGAPGNRMADDGTLWLDWPSAGGPSPDLPIQTEPEKLQTFCHYSARVQVASGTPGIAWVACSGVRNLRRLTVTLGNDPAVAPRRYTVRLHFAEIEDLQEGQRVFHVRMQDREVISGLDIVREAQRPMTALVKEVGGIPVTDKLTLEFIPAGGDRPPLLSGIEIRAEGW